MFSITARINRCLAFLCIAVFSVAIFFLSINYVYFHYHGNNYFPSVTFSIGISLVLILIGLKLQFNRKTYIELVVREALVYFFVMALIALLTNAIQFTPFKPIDAYVLKWETALQINLVELMAWTAKHPWIKYPLNIAYLSIAIQMGYIPLIVIVFGQFIYAREFYCLLLISALIGFIFYYFFPTTAPASVLQSPYFTPEQHATGIKFQQIHHHLIPYTADGGLIALPSFHAIWAWYCSYILRFWKYLFILALLFNGILVISCVLLGWHYVIDIIGSLIVVLLTQYFYFYATRERLAINPFGNPRRIR